MDWSNDRFYDPVVQSGQAFRPFTPETRVRIPTGAFRLIYFSLTLAIEILERKNLEINPLLEKYGEYIKKINDTLDSELELYTESEFKDPLKYALDGGKRIRQTIVLMAAECVGEIDDNTLAAACAIEFLHTESVIHDDIIDNETLRLSLIHI